ncbi:GNAT family N-acetyltransferase [Wenxinia marina]|uniref:Acetyltransferase n=1 Tax=Wenxinia marina DSM 24838 TaxID=1123501 RepID=A0A0D0Q074_9RHOB|nr:GNAT family N-acetyltransferase [Wenxinia marina]KIQ68004.1 Acetyltransferase [Wenxinia marina DSM 24838]GGL75471.1 N-acetyltransferase [Wenxinia marina]
MSDDIHPWQQPAAGQAAVAVDRIAGALPRIARGRVILRAPYMADWPLYRDIATSERAVHFGGPMSEDEAWADFLQMVASWLLRGCGLWAVEVQETAETVGFVVLNHEAGDPEAELGFIFTEDGEGHGWAFEASVAARNNAFFALNWETLVSYIAPENERAAALAAKLGATRDPDGDVDGVHCWRYPRPEFDY